jgi:hypothetical protein
MIEEAIDCHFVLIKEVIETKKKEKMERDLEKAEELDEFIREIKKKEIETKYKNDPDLMFDDHELYTYRKKLEQLNKYYEALLEQDRN